MTTLQERQQTDKHGSKVQTQATTFIPSVDLWLLQILIYGGSGLALRLGGCLGGGGVNIAP